MQKCPIARPQLRTTLKVNEHFPVDFVAWACTELGIWTGSFSVYRNDLAGCYRPFSSFFVCLEVAWAGAGSRARVGVYDSDGNGKPNALLVESGELNIQGWGMKQTTIDLTLDKGLYFIAFLCNTYSAYLDACAYFLSPIGGATEFFQPSRWERNYTYGPLPNPFGTPNADLTSTEILGAGLRLAELL